jgi:hypothetical protein
VYRSVGFARAGYVIEEKERLPDYKGFDPERDFSNFRQNPDRNCGGQMFLEVFFPKE